MPPSKLLSWRRFRASVILPGGGKHARGDLVANPGAYGGRCGGELQEDVPLDVAAVRLQDVALQPFEQRTVRRGGTDVHLARGPGQIDRHFFPPLVPGRAARSRPVCRKRAADQCPPPSGCPAEEKGDVSADAAKPGAELFAVSALIAPRASADLADTGRLAAPLDLPRSGIRFGIIGSGEAIVGDIGLDFVRAPDTETMLVRYNGDNRAPAAKLSRRQRFQPLPLVLDGRRLAPAQSRRPDCPLPRVTGRRGRRSRGLGR